MKHERIREIAREVGLLTHNPENRETKLDKFAELIIRECLSYAKDGDIDFMKFMIEQNFGIEE